MARASTAPPDATATGASTPLSERALAPDLARGMMLLLIALANVPFFIYGAQLAPTSMHAIGGSIADTIVQGLTITFIDARTYTMFAFLFAYGIGQLHARQIARGRTDGQVRRILRTRHLWMVAFGAVHALLVWHGDILGTYGLLGLILVPLFVGRSDRTLKIWLGVLLGIAVAGSVLTFVMGLATPATEATAFTQIQQLGITEEDYLASALIRIVMWVILVFSEMVTLGVPIAFLIGVLAARHRILDEPARHLKLLSRIAWIGIPIGVAAGAVQALNHVGVLTYPGTAPFGSLHMFTGIFAGVGYAALFGLIAHRISTLRWPGQALVALGRRSLSGYLTQSVVFGLLLLAWALGLGAPLTAWSAALLAVGTWLATLVGAWSLERAGIRGPAEWTLRKLTYRKVEEKPSAPQGA